MKPYNIINPIARALALSRRRTQVIPNKKKKEKSRKNNYILKNIYHIIFCEYFVFELILYIL